MRLAPGLLEGGGAEVATVGARDGGPEVQAVGIVDFVQAGYVDCGLHPLLVPIDVFCDEAEAAAGCGGAAGDDGLGEDGDVGLRGLGRGVLMRGFVGAREWGNGGEGLLLLLLLSCDFAFRSFAGGDRGRSV